LSKGAILKTIKKKKMQQEFKVGQKVKVNSGWNISELVKNCTGATGIVTEIDCTAQIALTPCIWVEVNDEYAGWVYPLPDEGRAFDVEILEDVQAP
jgi:hypothetical protein